VTFDIPTQMLMSSLAVVLCGIAFIMNTTFTRTDPTGRAWSVGFVSAITVAAGYGVTAVVPEAWWGTLVGNIAFVTSVGALWSGARLHNGRKTLAWVVAAIAAVVAIVTSVQVPHDEWAGATVLWPALALFSILGGIELQRGRLRRNVNGRSLGIVLLLNALFLVSRTVVFLADGPEGELFDRAFNSGIAAIVTMAVVITAVVAVSVLRTEQGEDKAVGDLTEGIHSRAGVLSARAFEQAATDHLARAEAAHTGMAVIGADIDRLPEVNTAFGRAAGDEAIAAFAQSLRRSAPVMAVIGHPSAGRFLILVAVASATEALTLAEHIQTALVDDALPDGQQIRLTASFGVADVFDYGYSLDSLKTAVGTAIDHVKTGGGNRIYVI
jgi:diguanylate cyclase (GGDEF)-like protein